MNLTEEEKQLLIKLNLKKEKRKIKYNEKKQKLLENIIIENNENHIYSIDELKQLISNVNFENKEISKKTKTSSSINTYLNLLNTINNIIIKRDLNLNERNLLIDILNYKSFDYSFLKYLNDIQIENTILILRNYYSNDNTFRNVLNILNIITNHNINLISKLFIYYASSVKNKRKQNKLNISDKDKIIDLNRNIIIQNIENLKSIDDKLLYSLYTLIVSRRLEWRKVIIKFNNLNLTNYNNYMIILNNNIKCIFNDYKTFKNYGTQELIINDTYLINIILEYIKNKNLNDNDLLFSQIKNKNKEYDETYFSKKIIDLFYTIYKIPISLRFIRISHIVHFNKYNTNPTYAQRELLAQQMGHSVDEQLLYNKII